MNKFLIFLFVAFAVPLVASSSRSAEESAVRTFHVRQTVKLDEIPIGTKQVRWWISIPGDGSYQNVLDFKVVESPGAWRIAREPEHGNQFLYLEASNPQTTSLEAVVEFTLRREPVHIQVDSSRVGLISSAHRVAFADELRLDAPHMVVTSAIQQTADKVCGVETNPAVQARLLLDYVAANADHYSKDPSKPTCGVGDADNCMINGGGCCTDLHSLFIALARARGVPTRLQMGYRLQEKNEHKEVDPGYRCWVEYFLPGYGWVPADIVEADAVGGFGPQRWFTGLTERRLWLNEGREFLLNPRQSGGRVNTMVIGYAELDGIEARVLPDGELKPQLTRRIEFHQIQPNGASGLTAPHDVSSGSTAAATELAGERTRAPEALAPAPASAVELSAVTDSIWNRLSLSADGRIREESTYDQTNGEDRHRGRMRFRAGALYNVTEEVRAEMRVSTAAPGGDANNPHWDFGDGSEGFSGADLVLDRFYLNWKPRESLDLRAGKFGHAFTTPTVFGELQWDADVSPSGLAAIWTAQPANSTTSFDLRAVEYIAVENGGDSDPSMTGIQGNLALKPAADWKLQMSCAYSHWSSLNAGTAVLVNQGNTDVAGDFGILEGVVATTFEGGPLGRTSGFIQVMENVVDDDRESSGIALGFQLGKAGRQSDFNAFAVWYDLDANCVYSPVAQDDTPIPGTGTGNGMAGVIFGCQYFIADNLSIKLWALTSDANAAEDPYRIRLDIDFKVK